MAKDPIARGAVRFDKATGMTRAESAENNRSWTPEQYVAHNDRLGVKYYDITRRSLNFSIGPGAKIYGIDDTERPEPTHIRLQKRCDELDFHAAWHTVKDEQDARDYGAAVGERVVAKNSPCCLLKFVISGNVDVVRNLAFGSQAVDYARDGSADNSVVKRERGIEDFSRDVYRHFARKFGEKNIVGFDVHLDENSPHIHISVVPVGVRKRSGKEFVSRHAVMGHGMAAESKWLDKLHTDFANEVGVKYGLERGVRGSNAKHKDIITWARELIHLADQEEETKQRVEELKQTEKQLNTKIKGLRTMITNLEKERDGLQTQISSLESDIALGRISREEGQKKLDDLLKRTAECETKLQDKTEKLETAIHELDAFLDEKDTLKNEVADISSAKEAMVQETSKVIGDLHEAAVAKCAQAAWQEGRDFFSKEVKPRINNAFFTRDAEESVFGLLSDDAALDLAANLFLGVAPFSVSSGPAGGGTSHSDIPWGKRKDDEDDLAFAKRCNKIAGKYCRQQIRGATKRSR